MAFLYRSAWAPKTASVGTTLGMNDGRVSGHATTVGVQQERGVLKGEVLVVDESEWCYYFHR